MSISDPLLKELKGHVARLLQDYARDGFIADKNMSFQPFCETLETIFHRGLVEMFPLKRAECWYWLENIANPRFQVPFTYCSAVELSKGTCKISTPRGRFRHLVRICLARGCLHVPVEKLVHMKAMGRTYMADSILGDEILGEILLSVLLQCSKIKFRIQLENAAFLDDTWQMGRYEKLELVPCKTLGLCIRFLHGKGVVVKVEPSSVAAEDDKVVLGDLVDEINSHPVTAAIRSKLGGIMRQAAGKPITLNLVKAQYENGVIYPPLRKLHVEIGLSCTAQQQPAKSYDTKPVIGGDHKPGFAVDYLGEVSTGDKGDVAQIERAIFQKGYAGPRHPVQLEILEMGVRVTDRKTDEVLAMHSYMEISSCGRQQKWPTVFAYIAGDCSCNVASNFKCYIFQSRHEEQIVNILQSIAQGFQRTHFAV